MTEDDFQYLNFLKMKYRQFPTIYLREVLAFKDFMSEENFVQWYSDYPQYKFDKGQAPAPEDFSSRTVYDDLMKKVEIWKANNSGQAK